MSASSCLCDPLPSALPVILAYVWCLKSVAAVCWRWFRRRSAALAASINGATANAVVLCRHFDSTPTMLSFGGLQGVIMEKARYATVAVHVRSLATF